MNNMKKCTLIAELHHTCHLLILLLVLFIIMLLTSLLQYFVIFYSYHRLNGSLSPVLTATCLSYGSLCDFLLFYRNMPVPKLPLGPNIS